MEETQILPRQYTAFISFRHTDNREEGRRWAEWLHQLLETYEIPKDLAGKINSRGSSIPKSLYPVFRDEVELSVDAELSTPIKRALENSDALIVLCSPRSAQSRFVAEEIRLFKEMGKANRIFALILDGEPNAIDPKKTAIEIDPAIECFPEPLRFGVLKDGVIDWTQPTQPIAADVRPAGTHMQGYTAATYYRAALEAAGNYSGAELRRLHREYSERLELARLKLIAGVIGVPLGQLRNRDAAHRAKKFRRLAITFGLLFLITAGAAAMAWHQRGIARREQQRALRQLSENYLTTALQNLSVQDRRRGVAYLIAALRQSPENEVASARLLFELANRDWLYLENLLPFPAQMERQPGWNETSGRTAKFSKNGQIVELTTLDSAGRTARIFHGDLKSGAWQTTSDHRKREPMDDQGELHEAYDFAPTSDPDDVRTAAEVSGAADSLSGTIFFSTDRNWAAAIEMGETSSTGLSLKLIDWKNRKLIRIKLNDNESSGNHEFLTGIPTFDPKQPRLWLHSSTVDGNEYASHLQSVALPSGDLDTSVSLRRGNSNEDGRPIKISPDGSSLAVRIVVPNRIGEEVQLFRLEGTEKTPKIENAGQRLCIPGRLNDLSESGKNLLTLAPLGAVIHRVFQRTHLPRSPAGKPTDFFRPERKLRAQSPDGLLVAQAESTGNIRISPASGAGEGLVFETEYIPGEGGRSIVHLEFSEDSRLLLVWGVSVGAAIFDTEIYDVRSGRLIYPKFTLDDEIGNEAIQKLAPDGLHAELLNGTVVPLPRIAGRIPGWFLDFCERVNGAQVSESGNYQVIGSDHVPSLDRWQMPRQQNDPAWDQFVRKWFPK